MEWDAIGAIGEVIGAAGVIFSLLYLGSQIRSSTRQANADAVYKLQKAQVDIMESFTQPEVSKLFVKLEKGEQLEDHEKIQVNFIIARVTGIWAAAQASANSGVVDSAYLDDASESLGIFAMHYNLANGMWGHMKRAHASVMDGQVFKVLRSAAEATKS